jgi:hypothetical protein
MHNVSSREFKQFCFELGIKHVTTSPYYPQPLHAKRFNQNLCAALIAYHSEARDTWDQQLVWLQLAFNTAKHKSTKSAPFAIMFPFRSGSPSLNRWKISKLLPEKVNKRVLQKRWSEVRKCLCKSQANVACAGIIEAGCPSLLKGVILCTKRTTRSAMPGGMLQLS